MVSAILSFQTLEDFARTLALIHSHSINAFFTMKVFATFEDPNLYVPYLQSPGLSLGSPHLYSSQDTKDQKLRESLQLHIQKTLKLAGLQRFATPDMAKSILDLEEHLARHSLPNASEFDPKLTNRLVRRADLAQEFSSFPLDTYLEARGIDRSQEQFNLSEPEVLRAVNHAFARTPREKIQAYLLWKLIHNTERLFSEETLQEYVEFWEKKDAGQTKTLKRSERCFRATLRNFDREFHSLYKKRLGDQPQVLEKGKLLFDEMKASLIDRLRATPWLDEKTRHFAVKKARTLSAIVGFEKTKSAYTYPMMSSDAYLVNQLSLWRAARDRNIDQLRTQTYSEKGITPWIFNASYFAEKNRVEIPLALLTPPSFDPEASLGANMGSLGFTIGHEMIHGFDNTGRAYGANGNIENWWSPDSEQQFEERASCLVNQANAYTIDGVPVNGKLILGENIADNGGIKLAYSAYKNMQNTNRTEASSSLEDQDFFLAYAQSWCSKSTSEEIREQLASGDHAPEEFRVNSVLSNLKEFSRAFSCREGKDRMSPALRCEMW